MKEFITPRSANLPEASSDSPPACYTTLEGEVFYMQRIALPLGAHLSVSLEDVSWADASSVILASHAGPVEGNVPLPFSLSYDLEQIIPGHSYAVSARIELDGELLFINTEHHGVTLDGQDPQPLRIKVDPVR